MSDDEAADEIEALRAVVRLSRPKLDHSVIRGFGSTWMWEPITEAQAAAVRRALGAECMTHQEATDE